MIDFTELLQSAYLLPLACGAGLGLVLFLAGWWRGHERRNGGFTLLLTGLAWVLCHLVVNENSYFFPPKEPVDWLVFGAVGMVPVAIVVWLRKRGEGSAAVFAAMLLGMASWLALHQLSKGSWLVDRGESARDRWLWTSGIVSAVLAAFGAAEASARKVPGGVVLGSLAVFTALAAGSLFLLTMPKWATGRLLAVAGLAAGATVAAAAHQARRHPVTVLPAGMAGWLAGGTLLLFILGCLSRVSGVPVFPMGLAAAALPVAALLIYTFGRITGGPAVVFAAVLVIFGGALVALGARDREQREGAPAATGADDTGAYDGL